VLLPLLGANGLANIEACYLGGKSYVPGGTVRVSGNFIYTGTMFIYDTVADSWTLSVNYPGLGSSHPAVVCDPASNKVYAIGGLNSSGIGGTNLTRIYDVAASTWLTDGAAMPTTRYGADGGLLSDGRIIVAGGRLGGQTYATNTVEIYDTQANIWSAAAPLNVVGADSAHGVAVDGRFYVAGSGARVQGGSGEIYSNHIEAYNPTTNTWTVLSDTLLTGGDVPNTTPGCDNDLCPFKQVYDPSTPAGTLTAAAGTPTATSTAATSFPLTGTISTPLGTIFDTIVTV